MFETQELKQYQKHLMLEEVGLNGQLALKKAKVAVVGAGGLGCPILAYLTSMGIGTIGVIDFDVVDVSNLHRQILYSSEDLGQKKAHVAVQKLKLKNPYVRFAEHDAMLNESNCDSILNKYDFVVDGSDNFLTRYLVNDTCVKLNKPLIYGSILGFQGQLAVFNFKGSRNLRDIFPVPPNPEDVPSCSENGVLGIIPGIIGTMMANEVVNAILDKNVPVNQFKVIEMQPLSITVLEF